jgi:alkylated DNA nucleotide flippase Atl1
MMQATGTSHQALQRIWKAVRAVPRGQVSSYGTVAKRAGLPGRARLVGYALENAPGGLSRQTAINLDELLWKRP